MNNEEQSPTYVETVAIEQCFKKRGDEVYWCYRFNGDKEWSERLTGYKEIPVFEVDFNKWFPV